MIFNYEKLHELRVLRGMTTEELGKKMRDIPKHGMPLGKREAETAAEQAGRDLQSAELRKNGPGIFSNRAAFETGNRPEAG